MPLTPRPFLLALLVAASPAVIGAQSSPTKGDTPGGIDPDKEFSLFEGASDGAPFDMAFPGSGLTPEDPVTQIARRKYAAAAFAAETGPPVRAYELFKEAAEADPENTWIAIRAIDAAITVNDLAYAQSTAEGILKYSPNEARAMVRLGTVAMYREKYDLADEWFQKVLAVEPNNTEALTRLAQISYDVRRDFEKTKEYTARLLTISMLDLQAMLWNAQANALTGDVEQAAELYDRLLRYRPSLVAQLDDLARRLLRMGRDQDAMLLYSRGIAMAPNARALRANWEALLNREGGQESVLKGYQDLVEKNHNDPQIQELFAEYLARIGDNVRLRELRRWMLQADGTYVPAMVDLARMALADGNMEEADKLVNQAIAIGTDDPDVYRMIGKEYLAAGHRARAKDLLNRAIILDPKDAEALRLIGLLFEEEKDYKTAEENLRAATDAEKANPIYLRSLAEFFLRRNRSRESIELFQQVLAADPKDYQAQIQLAELYFRVGDSKGLDLVEQSFASRTPDNDEMRYQYGLIANRYGEFERARKALEKVVELLPGLAEARYSLALAYVDLGRQDLADKMMADGERWAVEPQSRVRFQRLLASYFEETQNRSNWIAATKKLVELDGTSFEAHRAYTLALSDSGRESEALAQIAAAEAQALDTDPVELTILRATVLRENGHGDEALKMLIELRVAYPDAPEATFQTAYAAGDLGNLALAEQCYRELMHARKETDVRSISLAVLAANNLSYLLARRNERLEEALELVKVAMEDDPDSSYILDTYGYIQFRLGEFELAQSYMERAARRSPRDAEMHANLGDLYVAMGRLEAAKASYTRAIALDPNLDGLKEKVASLSPNAGTPEKR